MRYFLIAGEPSGDQHAAALMNALRSQDQAAEFRFLGGERMAEIAGDPMISVNQLAIMGFTQVLTKLPSIVQYFRITREALLDYQPDALILVDYGGFNLRIARWASKTGFRVFYYIPPKVWAWNRKRVHALKRYTEQVFAIFPFEADFLSRHGVKCTYVGNPLMTGIQALSHPMDPDMTDRTIALVPGSRKQEIKRLLPVMARVAANFPDYRYEVAAMSLHQGLYESLLAGSSAITVCYDEMHPLIRRAQAALVTSGTATLETALLDVPQVVCYKTNQASYVIARLLIKVRFISLVNLLLDRLAVPELIQKQCTEKHISKALSSILPGGDERRQQLNDYSHLREILGESPAAENVASLIIKALLAR